jgi:O-antigen ligase
MGVILLVLFALSAQNMKKMQRFLQILLLFSAACVVSCLLTALRGDEAASTDGELLKAVNSGWFAAVMTLVSIASLTWMYRCKRADRYCKKAVIRTSRIINGVCAALVLLVLLLAAVNTIRPGSLGKLSSLALFTFTETWGSSRGATWKAALCCFWEQNFLHKLVGVGPDAMSAYMYTAGSAGLREMLERCFGTATLTNAHNEWLTVLADTGLLGLLSFAGIMISAIRLFVKRGEEEPVLMACGFCLLAYTVNNIFSFQQTANGATMYVLLGMGMAFARKPKDNGEHPEDEIIVS